MSPLVSIQDRISHVPVVSNLSFAHSSQGIDVASSEIVETILQQPIVDVGVSYSAGIEVPERSDAAISLNSTCGEGTSVWKSHRGAATISIELGGMPCGLTKERCL